MELIKYLALNVKGHDETNKDLMDHGSNIENWETESTWRVDKWMEAGGRGLRL